MRTKTIVQKLDIHWLCKRSFSARSSWPLVSAVLLLLALAGPARATDYYIATNGNDTTGDGSFTNEYATVKKATDQANPGDYIYVRGGTYNLTSKLSISRSGTAAQPIHLQAYAGEHPILNCGNVGSGTDGIGLTGSYWHFYRLDVTNAPHNGIKIQGSNSINPAGSYNTIELCTFHHCGDTGFMLGSSTSTTYVPGTNLILNCDVYRCYDTGTRGGNADGFAAKWYIGTGNVFRGCRSWENSDDGWDLWMARSPVLIDTCWTWRSGSNVFGVAGFAGNGNGFKLGGSYVPAAHRLVRSVAYQNVGNGGKGIDQNNNTAGLTIDNNTSWGNRAADINMNTTPTTAGVHVVRNNLVISGTTNIQASAIQISNSWQVITSPDAGTNDVLSMDTSWLSAPRQADGSLPITPLVRPVPNGRLVDKGADIGEPFSGSAPDLGAYESIVLTWRGDGVSNMWDSGVSSNWLDGLSLAVFTDAANVTFDDTGSNSPDISLVGTLSPSLVTVTNTQNYTFSGAGSLGELMMMSLVKSGTGQLTVTTGNTFGGGTTVSNGTLLVNNTAGSGTGTGAVTVVSGATLGGYGTIGGPVTVDGTLSPGNNGVGTLTVSNGLALSSASVLQYELGTNSDLTVVNGNLTLDGTLNITNAGGFTNATYTLFRYGGTLTTNGSPTILTIGTVPDTNWPYIVDISTAGYVKLYAGPATPPEASFTGSPTNGARPLAVTFTDSSTGFITNWFWDFGDGTTNFTVATNPVHIYNAAGTNTVSLTVFGPLGTNTLTRTDYIVVTNPPQPVAGFSANPTNGAAPLTVTFTDSSTGNITNRFWNFGDSNTTNFATATNPVHTYNAAGTNTVSLMASGPAGSDTITRSNYIVVVCPPQLVVSPASRDYGSVTVGQTNGLNFSVINTGCMSLTGTAVSAGAFAVSAGSPYSVPAGSTGTVTVAFAPVSAGNFTNNVIFASNGGVSTNQVTGIGLTPGNIAVTPPTYDFTNTSIGVTNTFSFVVTNTGGTVVTNGTATMVTSNTSFSIVSGSPFSLAGGGSTNVVVQFAPADYGMFTNNVAFDTANGGHSTNQVTGSAGTPPCISVTPATYGFPNTTIGMTNQTTFVVTNTGSAAVTNGTAAMETGGSPFSIVSNATFSVAGFGSANVVVQFAPVAAGVFTNNVAFNSANGGVSTNQVTGIGLTPGSITVTPASYGFGILATGTTAQTTFVVANTGGTAVTNGTATMVTSNTPFSVVSNATFSVAGFGATNVVVRFAPVTSGVFTNNVAFNTANGGVSTNMVTGAGTPDLTPPTLTILNPTDYEVFNTNRAISVSGTASDASGIAGVTVNGATATLSGTNWSRGFTLLSGTNTITVIATDNSVNRNVATQIVHAVLSGTFSNRAPVIVTPPVVTNALLQVDGLAVVAAGDTNTFSVGAVDPDGDSLSYIWSFGDGVVVTNALSNTAEHVYTTNCGPYTAGVSVSDGDLAVSSNLTVAVACQLTIIKMQVKLNFAKANTDGASLTAVNLDLGAGFGVTNKVVRVDIGGTTNVVFTLDANGRGVSGLGSCKLTYNKKAGTWGLTAKLAKGSWQTVWASYGLVNADLPKNARTIVTMPVIVVIGTDASANDRSMLYTAKAGKSGSAN